MPCTCSALGKHLFGTLHCLCYTVQNSTSCVSVVTNSGYGDLTLANIVGCNVSVVYTPGVS